MCMFARGPIPRVNLGAEASEHFCFKIVQNVFYKLGCSSQFAAVEWISYCNMSMKFCSDGLDKRCQKKIRRVQVKVAPWTSLRLNLPHQTRRVIEVSLHLYVMIISMISIFKCKAYRNTRNFKLISLLNYGVWARFCRGFNWQKLWFWNFNLF